MDDQYVENLFAPARTIIKRMMEDLQIMKKTYIALGALALTVITTVGLASATMAAGKNNNSMKLFKAN